MYLYYLFQCIMTGPETQTKLNKMTMMKLRKVLARNKEKTKGPAEI